MSGLTDFTAAAVADERERVLAVDFREVVAIHTPSLAPFDPDIGKGIKDGEHWYCVCCGVLPVDEPGAEHVARQIRDAITEAAQ